MLGDASGEIGCNARVKGVVAALDDAVLDHDALKHHVLTSLAMGSWGGLSGTVRRVADFMVAYRHFTSTFCTHLKETMKLVGEADPSGHFLEVLEENMEEEQGTYRYSTCFCFVLTLPFVMDQLHDLSALVVAYLVI